MENASKALIMAGAVLITVLLISLSMYVFNIIITYTEQSSIQSYSEKAEAFNRYFIYSSNDIDGNRANGIQIKGSEAYNIIAKINDINNDEWSLDEIELSVSSEGGTVDITDLNNFIAINKNAEGEITSITDDKKYTYSYTINSATGLVNKIILTLYI